MNQHKASFLFKRSTVAFALLLAGTAQAASWDFSNCSGILASGQAWASTTAASTTWNNDKCGQASEGVTIDLRGYSTALPNSGTRVEAWSGSGIGYYTTGGESSSNGTHSVDSNSGIDALILKFSQDVALNSVKIGWNGSENGSSTLNDSDLSIYRWEGTGAPTASNGTALTFSDTAWKLVNHIADVGSKTDNTASFSSSSSSYWLISAYNGNIGWSLGNDAFKLLAVAGTVPSTPGVPEPGSLALIGLGAAGLLAARRRAVQRR